MPLYHRKDPTPSMVYTVPAPYNMTPTVLHMVLIKVKYLSKPCKIKEYKLLH